MDTLLLAWQDVSVACIHHVWQPLLGGEPDATTTADKEVTRQVADALSITECFTKIDVTIQWYHVGINP